VLGTRSPSGAAPAWVSTSTWCSTLGRASRIAGSWVSWSRRFPPTSTESVVTRTRGSICSKRSLIPCTPKSVLTTDHTAPTVAVASISTTVSGVLGSTAHTRSPGRTPMSRR